MLTQLLFGEHFQILKEEGEWYFIRAAYDNYESWINKKQVELISGTIFKKLSNSNAAYTNDLVHPVNSKSDKYTFPLVIGSTLPFLKNSEAIIGGKKYSYKGRVVHHETAKTKLNRKTLIETAHLFLNSPYLWGGRSPLGIDCSGFTQIVFKVNGIKLERDSRHQAEQGVPLSFVEEAEPGDLAFFDNKEGRIIHVGIILKNLQIIHASGKVRIDKIDHKGIFNSELNQYTHNLRIIKRIN